ncbi:MAG: response regulator [Candidatus Marinimicrobia bacterium]|nr:response regulator [Candidatus Neomarinimicrobiota bacterium]
MHILKALIVDDEKGMRLGMQKTLERFKFTLDEVEGEIKFKTQTAATGEKAIEKVSEWKPDVMLLDYKLPEISGLEVLEEVTTEESEMVTVMVTAYASIDTAISAIKQGAFDFLAKPFEPEDLRKTVKKATKNLILAREVRKLEEEKKRVRFEFLSVLAHELKAPINAIQGYLNIITDRVMGDKIEDYDKMVNRSLVRIDGMKKMISDLLDLTRIESGEKKRKLEKTNVIDCINRAIDTAAPAAQEKDIDIELHAEERIEMECDRSEIEIIMNNLLSNAIKYNHEEGQVDISVEDNNDCVEISVADTGIGMTEEEQEKLFDEFTRIKNEKTRDIEGSGLGLSILQKIVNLYNGEIFVESEPDKGTKFIIKLFK